MGAKRPYRYDPYSKEGLCAQVSTAPMKMIGFPGFSRLGSANFHRLLFCVNMVLICFILITYSRNQSTDASAKSVVSTASDNLGDVHDKTGNGDTGQGDAGSAGNKGEQSDDKTSNEDENEEDEKNKNGDDDDGDDGGGGGGGGDDDEEEEEESETSPITYTMMDDSEFKPIDDKGTKVIIVWSLVYRKNASHFTGGDRFSDCKYKNCILTSDHNMLDRADALMFHIWNLRLMGAKSFPPRRYPRQRWIMYGRESPMSTLVTARYNNLFNHTHTYRHDSDTRMLYGCTLKLGENDPRPILKKNYAEGKTRIASWIVSHCNATSRRDQYVELLQQYIPVDIYGRCGPYDCFKKKSPNANEICHTMLAKKYKFYFSLENSLCTDYVTEKAFNPLNFDMVPIVMGEVDYARALPPNSYIDIRDFKSPKALADYLVKVDKDDSLYNKYFEWKDKYIAADGCGKRTHYCDLCEFLNTHTEHKVYQDAAKWWNKCKSPAEYYPGVADVLAN